jgi:uncharacterized protein (DUF1697 family)
VADIDPADDEDAAVREPRRDVFLARRPDEPGTYHSDTVFLMGLDAPTAMKVFDPRPGVDEVWPGTGVIYSQRLSAQRTKSRLGKIVGTPAYKSMTIRSWATTVALLERMEAPEA